MMYYLESGSHDPGFNLALEQYVFDRLDRAHAYCMLWQNDNAIIVGKNQNTVGEINAAYVKEHGIRVVRRLSGGGAVFHDLGNLNFTFLVPTADYDVERQLSVICTACRELGIPAKISGRNDVVVEGRKFSGNAFYQNGGRSYHHGTLLIHVDTEKMGRYLSPSKAKLEAKGVESVRSRVVNLREYRPGLTCRQMEQQLIAAFESVYGLSAEPLSPDCLDQTYIDGLRRRNGSREWLYGPKLPFAFPARDGSPGATFCSSSRWSPARSGRPRSTPTPWIGLWPPSWSRLCQAVPSLWTLCKAASARN